MDRRIKSALRRVITEYDFDDLPKEEMEMAKVDFIKNPIAAAIRTEKDFSKALKSDVDMIFLLHANIMTVGDCIKQIHAAGKKAMVHIDFAEGIGKDRFGIEYLAKQGVDGICTTRTNIVKLTREYDLISLQRFFMIDSHSVSTSIESMKLSNPDIVEIMPAIVTKKIKEFSSLVNVPVIAGGLAETEEEVRDALAAGADCVSTGESDLWSLKL